MTCPPVRVVSAHRGEAVFHRNPGNPSKMPTWRVSMVNSETNASTNMGLPISPRPDKSSKPGRPLQRRAPPFRLGISNPSGFYPTGSPTETRPPVAHRALPYRSRHGININPYTHLACGSISGGTVIPIRREFVFNATELTILITPRNSEFLPVMTQLDPNERQGWWHRSHIFGGQSPSRGRIFPPYLHKLLPLSGVRSRSPPPVFCDHAVPRVNSLLRLSKTKRRIPRGGHPVSK